MEKPPTVIVDGVEIDQASIDFYEDLLRLRDVGVLEFSGSLVPNPCVHLTTADADLRPGFPQNDPAEINGVG